MKRIFGLILAAMLVLACFAGCTDTAETVNDIADDIVSDVIDDTADDAADEVVPDAADDTAPAGYTRGTLNGNVFESEWIGLRFEATDDMVFATQEDLAEAMGVGMEIFDVDKDRAEQLMDIANLTTVYEMMASDAYGNNTLISVEKLTLSNMTVKQYIDALAYQMKSILGVTVDFSNVETVNIGGLDFQRVSYVNDVYGIEMIQEYNLLKKGDRMICIITTKVNDDADNLYNCFSAY